MPSFRLFHQKTRLPGVARSIGLTVEQLEERTVPTLLGQQLFPADNPWNQQITNAPVAANSDAIMGNIISQYGDGQLHPDFGQDYQNNNDLYGIPYNVVHGNSVAKVHVTIDAYPGESDLLDVPLPNNVVIEGDYQNGPKVGVDNRGDSHLLVYDVDNNVAYEFYRASRPSENSDGQWHADQETVWDMKTDTFRTLGYTSADAAGLSILAGLVRPDEALPVNQGGQGVINHAIRMTLQNNIILDQFLYPASHVANSNNNAAIQPPMGARFRLKASVDISQLDPESQIIAQAMKDYGLIVADNGSNFFISGASYSVDANNQFALTYDDNDIQDSDVGLKSLTFSDFEVVDLTPAVSDLSVHTGLAASIVTVIGQNFSGAAGHLQVWFGNTPATAVTVVDDSHVLAVAPAGSGTVDVRVQSGITVDADSDNVENTIFGYGISAIDATDAFTYLGTTSPPPVSPPSVSPPSVSPPPVSPPPVSPPPVSPPPVSPPPGSPPPPSNGPAPSNTPFNFDKLGAYRPSDGSWSLDSDGERVFDPATSQVFLHFSPPNVTGVAGDWLGTGRSQIGDFNNGVWDLDLNGNGVLDPGETFNFGQAGDIPVVGDWDGDPSGRDELGVFRAAPDGITGEFILDIANHKTMDSSNLVFTFGLATDHVIVGDWNGAGTTEVGVYRDAKNYIPADAGDMVFSINENGDHQTFTNFVFGLITDHVVIGDWNGSGTSKVGVYRDGANGFNAPGVALFTLDSGALMFNAQSQVFLFGLITDQFVSGNWPPTPPLLPAEFSANGAGPGAPALTEAQLAPVLQQAIANWAAHGANAAQLESVSVQIGTLNDNLLGWTSGNQITIDATADGWGWNTDTSSVAAGKMDLLTVVEHELGHELGLNDVDAANHPGDIMAATLPAGTRRMV